MSSWDPDRPWILSETTLAQPHLIVRLSEAGQSLTAPLIREFVAMDLNPRLRTDVDDTALSRADDLLRLQPSLRHVVLSCVSDIIALDAPSPDLDVSHSEPRWPTLLLTSFPPRSPVGDARLIESVVHEAMHLNLTNLERQASLTIGDEISVSPWRTEPRPVAGVLHGAYVFACLRAFFRAVLGHDPSAAVRRHLEARITTIQAELNSIRWDDLAHSLTITGRAVAEMIQARRDQSEL